MVKIQDRNSDQSRDRWTYLLKTFVLYFVGQASGACTLHCHKGRVRCINVSTHAHCVDCRKGRCTNRFTRLFSKDTLRNLPLAELDFVVGLDLRQNISRIDKISQGMLVTLKHWCPFTRWHFCKIFSSMRKYLKPCEFFCLV